MQTLDNDNFEFTDDEQYIFRRLNEMGINFLVVGGKVRDTLLGLHPKDTDIEVYNCAYGNLVHALLHFGEVDTVGSHFGVILLKRPGLPTIEFTLARLDNQAGNIGHINFNVDTPLDLEIEDAAKRRDFTINTLAYDPIKQQVIEPVSGALSDLMHGILRATSDHFGEDPLRVLRGMQFCSRLDIDFYEGRTVQMCKDLLPYYDTLSSERIWGEWKKLALSVYPSCGLKFLATTEWLSKYPQLDCLREVMQDPKWHPEGTVWIHTLETADMAARISGEIGMSDDDTIVLVLAAICHDMGKATTTVEENGRITSHGHEKAGVEPAFDFLSLIHAPSSIIARVDRLVENHMIRGEQTPRAIRRLSERLYPTNIEMLSHLIIADSGGRLRSEAAELCAAAKKQKVLLDMPAPILMGRHLIPMGIEPGPQMGTILHGAWEAQLDGEFEDEAGALKWVKEKVFD